MCYSKVVVSLIDDSLFIVARIVWEAVCALSLFECILSVISSFVII